MAADSLVVRHAQRAVEDALTDTRVVVVLGARQVGKSTLLEQSHLAEGAGRELVTLDRQATRAAAAADPAGFVAALRTPVAIDEVQRVPELMTEIKLRVDHDKMPGQFAITGSANLRIASDLDLGGMFYETFVAAELARQISWLDDRPRMYHFRDRDQREVDIVLERRDGSVTAIEVKAAATVHERDLRGLKHLRDKLGRSFKAGALLYAGAATVPFGDRLAAVPLSGLWTVPQQPS